MKFIDEMIQEAQKRGDFSNLEGEGKPLELEDNPYNKETRLAHNMVKKSGFTLAFIAERKVLEELIGEAKSTLKRSAKKNQRGPFASIRWRKAEENFRAVAADLNKKIRNYNLKAPREQFQLLPIDIEREISKVKPNL